MDQDANRRLDELTEKIIGAAITIHKELGPGLLESAYEACLCYELEKMGIRFERQKELPLPYKEVYIDCGYRIDVLVEDRIIVEIKAVEHSAPIYQAQVLTYLKLSKCKVGLLINFNVKLLKQGLKRIVYDF